MRRSLLWLSVLLSLHITACAAAPAAQAASDDLLSWCRDVTAAIPKINLDMCASADLKPWAKSVNGRPILLHEFKPPRRSVARVLMRCSCRARMLRPWPS